MFRSTAPVTNGLILEVFTIVVRYRFVCVHLAIKSHLFVDVDDLKVTFGWCNEPVIWRCSSAKEDVEHQSDTLETEHIISVTFDQPKGLS